MEYVLFVGMAALMAVPLVLVVGLPVWAMMDIYGLWTGVAVLLILLFAAAWVIIDERKKKTTHLLQRIILWVSRSDRWRTLPYAAGWTGLSIKLAWTE